MYIKYDINKNNSIIDVSGNEFNNLLPNETMSLNVRIVMPIKTTSVGPYQSRIHLEAVKP